MPSPSYFKWIAKPLDAMHDKNVMVAECDGCWMLNAECCMQSGQAAYAIVLPLLLLFFNQNFSNMGYKI